ncbi:enoyl-CoA hydratase/isomerase family protein [Streptomyces armeniacus]|uniref:Enoyl-CoA hydratase/isomerase family protein n=1 Tax=Streptomyces armeniacus TaxID=83291 RepID=A0A345XLR9_9ACTN|nr:enoyl-CoA hydratase/isomerase family protein [Streptomyces armeniacus]AXK32585.1 enoyl-CoA hydratase/isomerase family protein [Streptomyces armeniacus]
MESAEGTLDTERNNGVATVTIRHTAKRNAMTPAMWRQLPVVLGALAADTSVRVLLLTGADGTFCAGADISTLRTATDGTPPRDAPDAPDAQGLAVAAEEALAAFPKPTLAVVRGHCVGGGCQLAAACDLRFAAEDALFGVTPAKLGVVYPATSTERLVRLVGPSTAKYLLFSAELIGSERALRCGLADEVHPGGELDRQVADFAAVLASRSQLTQAAAKEFADGRGDEARVAHWRRESAAGGDLAEGVGAFLERRPPRFAWSL